MKIFNFLPKTNYATACLIAVTIATITSYSFTKNHLETIIGTYEGSTTTLIVEISILEEAFQEGIDSIYSSNSALSTAYIQDTDPSDSESVPYLIFEGSIEATGENIFLALELGRGNGNYWLPNPDQPFRKHKCTDKCSLTCEKVFQNEDGTGPMIDCNCGTSGVGDCAFESGGGSDLGNWIALGAVIVNAILRLLE